MFERCKTELTVFMVAVIWLTGWFLLLLHAARVDEFAAGFVHVFGLLAIIPTMFGVALFIRWGIEREPLFTRLFMYGVWIVASLICFPILLFLLLR